MGLTLGIAGCGEVAVAKHLPALAAVRGIEVVAVADVNAARRDLVRQRFGIAHRYESLEQLLSHPGLDAVALCLPPALQAAGALAALDAGKHLWIDPPASLTLADCDRIAARAAAGRQVVLMGFHMRWHRLLLQARAVVQSGRLGTIQTLRAVWHSPRNPLTEPEWRKCRSTGGGALVEVAVDQIDLWRYLLDTEVADVFALHLDGQTEDESAVLSGRMANGVLYSAVLSERSTHDVEIELGGTAGRLRVSVIRFEGLEYLTADAMPSGVRARVGRGIHFLRELPRALPRMHRAGDYRLSYEAQWRHFQDCVAGRATPASTLDDWRQGLKVVLAGFASARTGRLVSAATISDPA